MPQKTETEVKIVK